ncbi:MAG TPA: cell division protein ZapD [Steroidobacteraceae bacterium]|nr:cell division protein ZapD [Steroidobacteraceae bacterium]
MSDDKNTTDYEQPLNERMRTFLRLEFLYQQLSFHQEQAEAWCTRAAVSALLEILAITARGDVRSDVLKELERHMAVIHEYQSRPGADPNRVHAIVANIAKLRTDLNGAGATLMQRLRDSEFLNGIKHRSAIPGGTCEFDLPDYAHWLSLPFETRVSAMSDWSANVRPLCDAVVELLWLTRQNTHPRRETASGGVFQLMLDKQMHCQLLRITLPAGSDLFPEISGSHHRCTIRFLKFTDVTTRPAHTDQDVSFLLTTCT